MRIGNRLFPYPTLNNEPSLSEYEATSEFRLCFDDDEDGQLPRTKDGQILKNAFFHLTDSGLISLYEQGLVECGLIIESSASTYRVMKKLTRDPKDYFLKYKDLKGTVSVSAYLYATEEINEYSNPSFQEAYKPYKFNIEKYDILAIDDGFRFQVNIDPTLDNKVASIFTIVPRFTNDKQMSYTYTQNNITIELPQDYYARYDNIKGKADFNNMMFAMIAIPALSGALADMKTYISQGETLDDLTDNYRWLRSVCTSFNRVNGRNLTDDDMEDIDPMVLAQSVLNDATCNGIEEISEHLLRGVDREEEEDEDDE
ncbi:MAG: hypothetical protein I3I98_04835 [Mobilibacterium timonense]|uniref:hypothetical protein n=1 Tax=Mobilibacterium timonense TaxID=1871012 RepID=UPI002357D1B8|nr:hypothetical protein [Mobilibacterium timonense]MBM6990718.1 hypothetical protein [Mobilibacterium timonense]